MRYCKECGARLLEEPGQPHTHDPTGLRAMQKNPLLALLIKPDGTIADNDTPVILGGGAE